MAQQANRLRRELTRLRSTFSRGRGEDHESWPDDPDRADGRRPPAASQDGEVTLGGSVLLEGHLPKDGTGD